MKKNILVLTILGGLSYLIFAANAAGVGHSSNTDATGASGAGTGANPGCSCHNNQTSQIAVTLQLDSAGVAVNEYHGGMSYTIKITGTNNTTNTLPKFGFQLACVKGNFSNAGGSNTAGSPACVMAGTWGTMPASVHTATGTGFPETVVEQSAALAATTGTGGTGTTYVVSIPWTAPAAGTGSVVLYGALNAVNGDGTDGGDYFNIANTQVIYESGHVQTCSF